MISAEMEIRHPSRLLNSILYFEEHYIKNFAEYVLGITDLMCKFGTEMLRDSLETMDCMLSAPYTPFWR